MAILKPKVPGDRGNPFTHTGKQKPSGAIPSDLNIPRQVSNVGRWLPYVGDFFEQQHIVSNPRLTAQQKQKQLGEMVPYQMLDLINPVASVIPKRAIRKVASNWKDLVPTSPIRWGYSREFAGSGGYGQQLRGKPIEITEPQRTNPSNYTGLIAMLPEHFRHLNPARPTIMGGKSLTRRQYKEAIEPALDAMRKGEQFKGAYYPEVSNDISLGFAPPILDVQWDDVFKRWQVTGHEGRGRALMAEQVAPDQLIPVELYSNPYLGKEFWRKGREYADIAADEARVPDIIVDNMTFSNNLKRWWDDPWFGRGANIPDDALLDYVHTRSGYDTPRFWEQLGFDASRVKPRYGFWANLSGADDFIKRYPHSQYLLAR